MRMLMKKERIFLGSYHVGGESRGGVCGVLERAGEACGRRLGCESCRSRVRAERRARRRPGQLLAPGGRQSRRPVRRAGVQSQRAGGLVEVTLRIGHGLHGRAQEQRGGEGDRPWRFCCSFCGFRVPAPSPRLALGSCAENETCPTGPPCTPASTTTADPIRRRRAWGEGRSSWVTTRGREEASQGEREGESPAQESGCCIWSSARQPAPPAPASLYFGGSIESGVKS